MEHIDTALEQRVWQRVHAEEQATGLQTLAAGEQTAAAVYLMLSKMLQGPEKAILRQLFERERSHSRWLNGIHLLQTGQRLTARAAPPENDRPEVALRKCYARTLQAIRTYEQRQNDPEFGHVFRELTRQEQEHCRMILDILGRTKP